MTFAPLALLATLLCTALPSVAATWRVEAGQRIGDTLAKAAAGDTIRVAKGVYTENLLIDKPLTLIGEHRPTLSGGNQGDVIRVTAPDVTVDGWIIRDSGGDLGLQQAGVYLFPGAHRARVLHCDFANVLFGLLPVAGLVIGRIGKRLKRTSLVGQQQWGTLMSTIEETLGGLRIVQGEPGPIGGGRAPQDVGRIVDGQGGVAERQFRRPLG